MDNRVVDFGRHIIDDCRDCLRFCTINEKMCCIKENTFIDVSGRKGMEGIFSTITTSSPIPKWCPLRDRKIVIIDNARDFKTHNAFLQALRRECYNAYPAASGPAGAIILQGYYNPERIKEIVLEHLI